MIKLIVMMGWCLIILMLASSCATTGLKPGAAGAVSNIIEDKPTTEELASAMGVRPYCADLKFPSPLYPRLIGEIVNEKGEKSIMDVTPRGKARDHYRIRIFCFENVISKKPEKIVCNLSAGDTVACNGSIEFPPESRGVSIATGLRDEYFYEAWTYGPNMPKLYFRIRFRIETSATPYPMPTSTIKVVPGEETRRRCGQQEINGNKQ